MISRSSSDGAKKKGKTRPPRILVLDDQFTVRDYLKVIIRHWRADAVIICRARGEAAWQEIQRSPPDMLITDMIRNGMDGYEMLRRLARWRTQFPILVISGFLSEEEVRNCAGAELEISCLPKPFQISDFIAELSRCVGAGDRPRR